MPRPQPVTSTVAHGNTEIHPAYTPAGLHPVYTSGCSHSVCEHPKWTPNDLLVLAAYPEQPLYSLPTEQALNEQMEGQAYYPRVFCPHDTSAYLSLHISEAYPGCSDGELITEIGLAHGSILDCVVEGDAGRLRQIGAFMHANIRWLAARMDNPVVDFDEPELLNPNVERVSAQPSPDVGIANVGREEIATLIATDFAAQFAAQFAEELAQNEQLATRVQAMLDHAGRGGHGRQSKASVEGEGEGERGGSDAKAR
ncbi:hypothetical protein P7C70_g4040, partial [Phenoliferia sp. Uapishka_3]